MADMKPTNIEFTDIGNDDKVPYAKCDVAKACQVGPNFALGFYQVDYQAIANTAAGLSSVKPRLMPMTKVVMGVEAFQQLRSELEQLAAKLGLPRPPAAPATTTPLKG